MLEEIYSRDDNLTKADYYDALLYLLGDVYPDLTEEEIEDMLEDALDRMPEQYAEGVLDTIANVGKKIGGGALQFTANNPELVKLAATTAGGVIGGPIGAKVGSTVGGYVSQGAKGGFLNETGKALALIQNPQTQAAMARATLGLGNGTAPLTLNGNTNMVPVATYLRSLISAAQGALQELDTKNIIPPASLSESMPYADDVDMQAEWLAEQLTQ